MSESLAVSAALLLGVALAHAPSFGAGLSARDYRGLLAPEPPLAAALGGLVTSLVELPLPGEPAIVERVLQFALLLLCGQALRIVLARMLEPRVGHPAARRAGACALVLLLVHPRAVEGIADLGARADLLGLTLALSAVALFLRGRQSHADALTSASPGLFLLAGLASPVGAPLALVAAVAEYASVRRHRRRSLRLRTAATTAAVFAAAALVPQLLARTWEPAWAAPGTWPHPGRTLFRLIVAEGASWSESALSISVLLAALGSAFGAARQAPRLWSGMLLVWATGCGLAVLAPSVRDSDLSAVTAWCAGLGVALAARPPVLSLRVAWVLGGSAILAHAAVRPLGPSAQGEGELWRALVPVVRSHGGPLLVLDPPTTCERDLGWLFHPRIFDGGHEPFSAQRVRGLSTSAFLTLAASGAMAGLRSERAALVSNDAGPKDVPAPRVLLLAPPAEGLPERVSWRSLSHVLPAALDPLDWEWAEVVADLAATPAQVGELGWDEVGGNSGVAAGDVLERGGRRVALFDLSRSAAWRLAGPVRGVRVERGVRGIERAELAPRAPELVLAEGPLPDGADWRWTLAPEGARPQPDSTLVLSLIALGDFETLELVPRADATGEFVARGAEAFRRRKEPAPVAWVLDYRVGPGSLQRARGVVR